MDLYSSLEFCCKLNAFIVKKCRKKGEIPVYMHVHAYLLITLTTWLEKLETVEMLSELGLMKVESI